MKSLVPTPGEGPHAPIAPPTGAIFPKHQQYLLHLAASAAALAYYCQGLPHNSPAYYYGLRRQARLLRRLKWGLVRLNG